MRPDSLPADADPHRFALRVALLYAVIGGAWILFSDRALEGLAGDPRLIVLISVFKGLGFVAVTALALWLLLRRGPAAMASAGARDAAQAGQFFRLPWQPLLFMTLAIVVLSVAGISLSLRQEEARSLTQLRAIADLKSRQLTDWLRERVDDARLIASARHLGEDYQRWRLRQDVASGERLRQDLTEFVQYTPFQGVQLIDAHSRLLFRDDAATADVISTDLRATAARARSTGQPIYLGPYLDAGGHPHLDFVVALPNAGGAVLSLHVDPSGNLFPLLQSWPEVSASGEVVWFRRAGDDFLLLSALRHRAGTATGLRLPLAENQALSARLLRGEMKPGEAVRGLDYRGVAVFGVVMPVPGSEGFVMAKLDEAELYAQAYHEAAWIVLAGLLALLALAVGVHLARQRRDLIIATGMRQAQAERLRAMHLLAGIADNSTDAIFAKDLAGRYLLFNRETARVTGKTAEEALQHDDTALFPPEQAAMLRANDHRVIVEGRVRTYEATVTTTEGERTFLATKGPLYDETGKVIGMYGISRDITERRRVEADLQRQMALNQRYLDTVQTLMVALDGEGRIVMINRKACELLGYVEEELLGRNWFETCLPQPMGLEIVYPVFRRVMTGQMDAAEFFENPVQCRDGHRCLIAWRNATIRDAEGRIVGALSSGEDISERKAAELTLHRHAEELKRRNEELERFNRATVGRELDMIALKRQVNDLSRQLGREPPYPLSFLDAGERPDGDGTP